MSVRGGGRATTVVPKWAKPFQAGGRTRAVCPKCREWITAGEWVKPAPGRGRVLKHVSCRKAG